MKLSGSMKNCDEDYADAIAWSKANRLLRRGKTLEWYKSKLVAAYIRTVKMITAELLKELSPPEWREVQRVQWHCVIDEEGNS